jgi:hypothetical protein
MKKMILLCLLMPIIGMSQTKNIVTITRVFPKVDKVLEFEKALAIHSQKYHTGDWKWRVFEIQSGPDANGYQITEGPTSWDAIDGRGNLGAEHNNDWNKNVAIFLIDKGSSSYSMYNADLSNIAMTDYADKMIINHMYAKPGMIGHLRDMAAKMKKAWIAGNESVAVYEPMFSGEPQIAIVTRLKGGLKELADGYRKPMAERYNAANGEGSFDYYLMDYAKYVESRWSEILSFRADLSSK